MVCCAPCVGCQQLGGPITEYEWRRAARCQAAAALAVSFFLCLSVSYAAQTHVRKTGEGGGREGEGEREEKKNTLVVFALTFRV